MNELRRMLKRWIFVSIFAFLFFPAISSCYGLNIDKVKTNFISGDYKTAIIEGEKILASSGKTRGTDELYYFLGLSYLKDANYLRASDIFEIILKEFKNSRFAAEARLGLGDSYLLKGDLTKAEEIYKEALKSSNAAKFKSEIDLRLKQCSVKKSKPQPLPESLEYDLIYSVQVGSFSNSENAKRLLERLAQKGYTGYLEEADSDGKTIYRVKIGKCRLRSEAISLQAKLSQEGYPTKVSP